MDSTKPDLGAIPGLKPTVKKSLVSLWAGEIEYKKTSYIEPFKYMISRS